MINDYISKYFDCSLELLEICNERDLVEFFSKQHKISITHTYLIKHKGLKALENPNKFLGETYGPTVSRLWQHIDNLTPEDHERIHSAWDSARSVAWSAARGAAWDSARSAAWSVAWDSARSAAWDSARSAAWDSAWSAARGAAWSVAWDSAWSAVNEIYGQDVMRSKNQQFYFCELLRFQI